MQSWYCLSTQASEQSSDANVINQQVIIDSTSDITILSEKSQWCVNVSRRIILDKVFIRKVAYTVAIVVVLYA